MRIAVRHRHGWRRFHGLDDDDTFSLFCRYALAGWTTPTICGPPTVARETTTPGYFFNAFQMDLWLFTDNRSTQRKKGNLSYSIEMMSQMRWYHRKRTYRYISKQLNQTKWNSERCTLVKAIGQLILNRGFSACARIAITCSLDLIERLDLFPSTTRII